MGGHRSVMRQRKHGHGWTNNQTDTHTHTSLTQPKQNRSESRYVQVGGKEIKHTRCTEQGGEDRRAHEGQRRENKSQGNGKARVRERADHTGKALSGQGKQKVCGCLPAT